MIRDIELFNDICFIADSWKGHLDETMSINSDVINLSNEIIDKLKGIKDDELYVDKYGRKACTSSFEVKYNDVTIKVQCKIVYFSDESEFNSNTKKYNWNSEAISGDDYKTMILNIVVPMIDNSFREKYLENSIYHEVAHIVEMGKRGGSTFNSKYNREEYLRLTNIMKNPKATHQEHVIATCLYASLKYERAAFLHGLYGILSCYNGYTLEKIYEKFLKTDQYKYMTVFKNVLTYTEDYAEAIEKVSHKDMFSFRKYLEAQYKKYKIGIGKIFYQVYNNFNNDSEHDEMD